MTFEALQTYYATLLDANLDNSEGTATATIKAQLNRAYKLVAKRCKYYDPAVTLVLTATEETYNLRSLTVVGKEIVKPYIVYMDHNPLWTAGRVRPGLWSMDEFYRYKPRYRDQTTNVPDEPVRAVEMPSNRIILDPAPSAAWIATLSDNVGGACYIAAECLPADLVNTTDVPDLPTEIHPAIAQVAAVAAATPVAMEGEVWQILQNINALAAAAIEEEARRNQNIISAFGDTSMYDEPKVIEV